MNRKTIVLTILLAAGLGRASVVTNFFSDLNSSANGSASTANLNAGTSVGTWAVLAQEESTVTDGVALFQTGKYTNQMTLASSADLTTGSVTVGFDFSGTESTTLRWNRFLIRNESDQSIIAFRLGNDGAIQVYQGGWQAIGSVGYSSDVPPTSMSHISITMDSSGYSVYKDETLLTSSAYQTPVYATSINNVIIWGDNTASSVWVDNVSVTSVVPEPITLGLYSISGCFTLLIRRLGHLG